MNNALFYLPSESWAPKVCLNKQEARHLILALRLTQGEKVSLFDGQGRTGLFEILEINKKNVCLQCLHEERFSKPASRAIVALAFSKAVRRGFFVEKAVELGADGIWIWQGDHSQGKLSLAVRDSLHGQMVAGAKQCANPWLPEVRVFTSGIDDVIAAACDVDYRVLPWEIQDNVPLLTPSQAGRQGTTLYIIGPEGGFSGRELAALRAARFTAVSLGARVLRCETAATLCLGIHWWTSQLPGSTS